MTEIDGFCGAATLAKHKREWQELLPNAEEKLDADILPLLTLMNTHPSFATTLSCAGHYRVCRGRVKQTFDDFELQDTDTEDASDVFCWGSTQPYLQFVCVRTEPTMAFLQRLRAPGALFRARFGFDLKTQECSFCYGDGDESYRPTIGEGLTGRPMFDAFWTHVIDAWMATMVDQMGKATDENQSGSDPSNAKKRKRVDNGSLASSSQAIARPCFVCACGPRQIGDATRAKAKRRRYSYAQVDLFMDDHAEGWDSAPLF